METKKYPLGVAFSGGGARAAAHCGALQAFHEYGIKPDVVSGTSAGALVATLYSSGFTPQQMIELFQGLNFFKDIVTPAVPKGGLFDSRPLVKLLRKSLPYTLLEELPIPTFVVASDLEHGAPKVFDKGESYLMVGIDDDYSLWLGGRKLERGAFVSVSLIGETPDESCREFTKRICDLLYMELGIPGDCVYVTYHPMMRTRWGWNGDTF